MASSIELCHTFWVPHSSQKGVAWLDVTRHTQGRLIANRHPPNTLIRSENGTR